MNVINDFGWAFLIVLLLGQGYGVWLQFFFGKAKGWKKKDGATSVWRWPWAEITYWKTVIGNAMRDARYDNDRKRLLRRMSSALVSETVYEIVVALLAFPGIILVSSMVWFTNSFGIIWKTGTVGIVALVVVFLLGIASEIDSDYEERTNAFTMNGVILLAMLFAFSFIGQLIVNA